jgi:hypothetical protein
MRKKTADRVDNKIQSRVNSERARMAGLVSLISFLTIFVLSMTTSVDFRASAYEILDIPVFSRDRRSLLHPVYDDGRSSAQLTDDEEGVPLPTSSSPSDAVDDADAYSTGAASASRVKRDVSRFGSTQHLKPPKAISPLPRGPRVRMPTLGIGDVAAYIERATAAVNRRFEEVEPAIFNNGQIQKDRKSSPRLVRSG